LVACSFFSSFDECSPQPATAMKIILSRKGFDSSSGGCPSPILPDGRLRSLPIPYAKDKVKYSQIHVNDTYPTGAIVEVLTEGKISADAFAHLDPDVDFDALASRDDGWYGVFGQSGSAQGHLRKQEVDEGDLFLFFGLFRRTRNEAKGLRFEKQSPEKHVIWGWLQIDKIVEVTEETAKQFPQFADHPHVFSHRVARKNNTIYTAQEKLDIPGLNVSLPGYGIFPTFDARLQLTAEGKKKTSVWYLPSWFEKKKLTYHSDTKRWQESAKHQNKVILQSAGRGQEFVCNLGNDTAIAVEWLRSIFDCVKSP